LKRIYEKGVKNQQQELNLKNLSLKKVYTNIQLDDADHVDEKQKDTNKQRRIKIIK